MRAIVQRVRQARVEVNCRSVGGIELGLLVYLGVETGDTDEDLGTIAEKVATLRIFEDDGGKMNLNVAQVGGKVLVVPAFSLVADARKGRRPSFGSAAEPALAERLYEALVRRLEDEGLEVARGQFQEHMHVSSVNDGPVCILLDSRRRF